MHVCMYVRMYACMYVCIYIYIYIYTYGHASRASSLVVENKPKPVVPLRGGAY